MRASSALDNFPAACCSRALIKRSGRGRLPTCSARYGGFVSAIIVFLIDVQNLMRRSCGGRLYALLMTYELASLGGHAASRSPNLR